MPTRMGDEPGGFYVLGDDGWTPVYAAEPIAITFDFTEKLFPKAERVIFANPSTIVYWSDGTKTIVTCQDNVGQRVETKPSGRKRFYSTERALPSEQYDKTLGLALCYMKRALGNTGSYNNIFRRFGAWS